MSADDDALLARRVDKIVAITDPETVEPTQAASDARECSFCQRTARWVVEGDRHAFRAWACGPHAHRALDLALFAGNLTTEVRPAKASGTAGDERV